MAAVFSFKGIQCTVRKHASSRRLRLAVESGGRVTLTVPRRVSFQRAEQFLREKQDWILAAYTRATAGPPRLLAQGNVHEYQEQKEAARRLITERVESFQAIYKVMYRKLSIRNQKTRFGSCSSRGHLSFNYRLLFLPEYLRDYVVVHEVCHLKELNHSRKFWALVAQTIPDYPLRKRQLQAFSRTTS